MPHEEKYVPDPHACPRCWKRGKTWQGSNPKCAFRTSTFNTDNWNCATMSALRRLITSRDNGKRQTWHCREDMAAGTFGVLLIPENDIINGYLCMTWYKSRGRTDMAVIMDGSNAPQLLTFEYAETILKALS